MPLFPYAPVLHVALYPVPDIRANIEVEKTVVDAMVEPLWQQWQWWQQWQQQQW